MSVSRLVSVLMLVALFLAAPPASASLGAGDRVVLMGDSEAFLLAWELPRLVQASGASFTSVTVPGSSVISWARELNSFWAKVRRARPTLLLVSLGANDACMGPDVVRNEGRGIGNTPPFFETFRAKLDKAKAKCVVWLGPPAIGAPSPTRSQCSKARAEPGLEMFAQMVQGAGITYFDARQIQIDLWNDHLHCSRPQHSGDRSRGCRDWAEWAWNQIQTEDLCNGESP